MEDSLQKSLERYDVLDRIAVGGMAEVFLAKAYGAHGFEKTLAIKRILPELARDPEFEARFISEAKVAVRLSHANVVQVFDFGRIGESLFIAMEYVDGLDLAALLRQLKEAKRLVPLPAAFHIAIEIMRALDFAHTHNVVHRDVSPSNILLSRAGEVKIGDFGIAVAAAPHRAAGPGARKVMGKWRYMSPEQTRGDTLDTRSDLFSAASVLYELFTNEKLFPGEEAEAITTAIASMPIPRASAVRPGLPSRLDDILAAPLARKPIDRPNRPATVLRSLIELSYESSIMATALDVAELVASVLPAKAPSGPGQHLDDVIRRQLGAAQAEPSVARRTAVTANKPAGTQTIASAGGAGSRDGQEAPTQPAGARDGEVSTGLFRKVDADGMSRLETTEPVERQSDNALQQLLDARHDPDRRTEVGGPPTGQVPKFETPPTEPPSERSIATHRGGSPRRMIALVAAAGALALGIGVWGIVRARGDGTPHDVVRPAEGDARAGDAYGRLEIDPDRDGAIGSIADAHGARLFTFGPEKPQPVRVGANQRLHVHVELAGYAAFDDDVVVAPGELVRVPAHLTKARARLHVVTQPPGAQVQLGDRVLGDTPLVRDDLEPAAGAELVLSRAAYEPARVRVDLIAGQTAEVNQTLKAAQRYGAIRVSVRNGWADVYFKGARVGDSSGSTIRLPIGRQIVHLKNPPAGKDWDAACEVDAADTRLCMTQMP